MILKILSLFSVLAWAYIPRGLMILHRTAESAGNGVYQIEQEVHFPTTQESVILKELWTVEADNALKLTVTGGKEFKDSIKMSFVYKNGEKTFVGPNGKQSKKLNEDFIEKYFHYRSSERFANALINMKIVPANILIKRIFKNPKEIEKYPENYIQLGRVGGVTAYAFGSENDSAPAFWIEQDQFVIKKFRLPSGAEVTADKYAVYSRGLNFPRTRTVRWDNNTVNIQTVAVRPMSNSSQLFSTNNLEPAKLDGLDQTGVRSLIEDFYTRFR
jgi:hypothetical protein